MCHAATINFPLQKIKAVVINDVHVWCALRELKKKTNRKNKWLFDEKICRYYYYYYHYYIS